ncbi:MAG: sodium/solute symporter [Oscillospiraceae bacterium]|jgi:SSS family solute:Na+ symporter
MITWAILIIYLISMIGIGVYCRKKAGNVSEFVLGGRNLGAWFTAFAYGTSYFSAVVFIGYAGQFGWTYGVSATWIGIGNAIIGSMLAWLVLGERTRKMSKHLNAATMPEFFEKRYNSMSLKTVAALIVFIFLIPYTASVYNGLSRLFEMAFSIPFEYCIIAMAILTAVYVILGGYMATAINDFIQGIIMLGGIIAVIIAALSEKGGIFTAIKTLKETGDGSLGSLFGPDPINLIGVVILTSLGTWGLPQMVHKFYAIKDSSAIKRGTIISTVFALIVAGGSYFLGAFGRLFVTEAEITPDAGGKLMFDTIVPKMLQSALPDILIGIVVVLVLSASMSTLSSLVLTSSSTVVIDLINPLKKKKPDQKQQVLFIRLFIAVFLIISVVIALNPNNYITTLMSISWGALAGAFLAPFIYGLFSKKITKPAVWASFITGVGITVIHMFLFSLNLFPDLVEKVKGLGFKVSILSPINAGVLAMLVGLIIVPIVSVFTKITDKKHIDEVFSCYNK